MTDSYFSRRTSANLGSHLREARLHQRGQGSEEGQAPQPDGDCLGLLHGSVSPAIRCGQR
jgi:hypothetical protein